jgi:2-methylisocitrate lyase-like PEP mutase family enzyme
MSPIRRFIRTATSALPGARTAGKEKVNDRILAARLDEFAYGTGGGRTPFLTSAELEQIGFRIVIYGISLLLHAVQTMEDVLSGLAHGKIDFAGKGVGFEDYKSIVGFERWAGLEAKYQIPSGSDG